MTTLVADRPHPVPEPPAARPSRGRGWPIGLACLAAASAVLTVWGVWAGSRSDYYASIALSMSKSWSNFFFGAFDPAGTVTLDKIPGSFWVPALFVKVFGFSTLTVILPNALAAVGASLLVASAGKRLAGPGAGLLAGAVVATTPILVAVSRSNQPETFFVLGLALTAWAAARAIKDGSFRWLMIAGAFVALSFQTYMLEAWAVWPALAAGYLATAQPWRRKLWQTAAAGATSLGLSLAWVIIVSLIPAGSRPYIGSTLHNSAWEMVFGYNGLGRFGTTTADSTAYNSFTPPFSGSAGIFRLFNEQLAGQIGWLLPVAAVAVVVLLLLRERRPVVIMLAVWLVTFYAMFAVVAGMHQFYTAALAVPTALLIGLAVARARARHAVWAQLALIATAVVTALAIGIHYGGYSIPVAVTQAGIGLIAAVLIIGARPGRVATTMTAAATAAAVLLTPAVWSAVTIAHPSSINPVAGGVSDMGGGGGRGGGLPGGGRGGFGGAGGPANQAGAGNQVGGNGQAGGNGSARGAGGFPGGGGFSAGGGGGRAPGGGGFGGTADATVISYLTEHQGSARYLVATFGAQSAASLIIATDGGSVLPIGGFSGSDPVPTLAEFIKLVQSGQLKYVMLGGMGGGGNGSGTAGAIRSWVEQHFTAVSDAGISGLYVYNGS